MYKPNTDIAFKKRIYQRYGVSIADKMCEAILIAIPDVILIEGSNRMVLAENVMQSFNLNEGVVGIAVYKGDENINVNNSTLLGVFNNKKIYGFTFKASDYERKKVVEQPVLPAVEERSIAEVPPIEQPVVINHNAEIAPENENISEPPTKKKVVK